MDKKDLRNKIEYIVTIVSCFAERFKLSNKEAYSYLHRFLGIDFLIKHYEVVHTLSIDNVVEDMQFYCYNKGGRIE